MAEDVSTPMPPAGALPPDVLAQLRDLQTPEATSWWPPAPGWWVVALLVVLALAALVWAWRRRNARLAGRREAEASLQRLYEGWQASAKDDSDAACYAQGVLVLLRQIAIHMIGRQEIARSTGAAFIARLNALSATPLPSEIGLALHEASYRPGQGFDVDAFHPGLESFVEGLEGRRDA
jgi:hypothetical protein